MGKCMSALSSFCFYFGLITLTCLNPITAHSTSRYFPERNAHIFAHICSTIFVAALFIKCKHGKQPKCPSAGGWINKLCSIRIIRCNLTITRKNELQLHRTWINLRNIIFSGICQTKKKNAYYIPPHIRSSRIDDIGTSLVVRTLCFHCRQPRFNHWLGN